MNFPEQFVCVLFLPLLRISNPTKQTHPPSSSSNLAHTPEKKIHNSTQIRIPLFDLVSKSSTLAPFLFMWFLSRWWGSQNSSELGKKRRRKMLQFFLTVAFSAVPLILYIPPIRSLNPFVETMEEVTRESRLYTYRVYPRLRGAWSRIMNCILCNNTS